MSEACEDRDGRAGGATMLQPVILRFTLNAACLFSVVNVLLRWHSDTVTFKFFKV